jgi:methyl-accepting chemotaxis protein
MERARAGQTQMERLSSSLTQITGSFAQVSSNTQSAAQLASQTAGAARKGGDLLEHAVAEMGAIREGTRKATEKINVLSQKTEDIRDILGVIEEIASSTNLLALNASIEAARAGEHGRGFGVVASEVRRLAERTADATKEVAERIAAVVAESRAVSEQTMASNQQIQKGVTIVEEAGHSLDEIMRLAAVVDKNVQEIAAVCTQDLRMAEEVRGEVLSLASATAESANGSRSVVEASDQLIAKASEMLELVKRFKIAEAA